MIGIIENHGIESNFKIGDSILITVKTDHLWCYLTSENKDELNQILKKLDQDKPDSNNENRNDLETEFKLRRLKLDDTSFIFAHSHYQQFTSKAYIKERIKFMNADSTVE